MFLSTFALSEDQDNDFINISIYSDAKGFQLRTALPYDRLGTFYLGELTVEQPR